jgi:PAS domain S-box-containing protein
VLGFWAAFSNPLRVNIDFEQLFGSSPNPYVVLDADLTIVGMNVSYLRATMRERAELVGRNMFEAFPSEPESESYRLLRGSFDRVLATGEADEIALIRYDIRNRDGSMDTRYWSATHTPFRDADGRIAYILQHTVDVTELQSLRALRDEMGVVQRAEAVQARNLNLAEESEQLRTLFEQAPGFVAVLSGPDHRFRMANAAYRTLVGRRDLIGKTVEEALPEVREQGFVELLDQVHATATPYIGRRVPVVIEQEGAGSGQERFLDFIYQPIVSENGAVAGIFVQGHDVTEQVETEEQLKLVVGELNHRVKNTLSIVQGLALQSFKNVDGADAAREAFFARLRALAAANGVLTPQNWEAADLTEIIQRSVGAAAGSDVQRFRYDGPDIMLDAQTAVSLAMVIHELTTNAIKYGALSQPGGSIDIRWTIAPQEDSRRLSIEWRERGGPKVEPPSRQGFGTRLIGRGMSSGAGSDVEMAFEPKGLRCTIVSRISGAAEGAEPQQREAAVETV